MKKYKHRIKIAYIICLLFIALTRPLQAAQPKEGSDKQKNPFIEKSPIKQKYRREKRKSSVSPIRDALIEGDQTWYEEKKAQEPEYRTKQLEQEHETPTTGTCDNCIIL